MSGVVLGALVFGAGFPAAMGGLGSLRIPVAIPVAGGVAMGLGILMMAFGG